MKIPDLKHRLNILQVAEHLGIKVDPRTKRALCPFHNDTNPSLQFSQEKQIATCFSANCTAGTMDVIKLTEKKLQITTHETLKYLTNFAGGTSNGKDQHPIVTEKASKNLEIIFKKLQESLAKSEKAKQYCNTRKLNPETLEIGYNSGMYAHLRNCIVFPLKDKENKIVSFYGRSISNNKEQRHFYLENRAGLYSNYPKQETEKIILTEAIIDAATLLQIDEIKNNYEIISCYGTNGLNEEIKTAIKELKNLKEIIFVFDNDEAGNTATVKYSKELKKELPNVTLLKIELPCKDVNDVAVAYGSEIFTELINNRKEINTTNNFFISEEKFSNEKKEIVENLNGKELQETSEKEKLNTKNPYKIIYKTTTATYYIKGGLSKMLDSMRITLEVENQETKRKFRDRAELYEYKQVERYARAAGEKLNLRKDLLEQDLSHLIDLLDEYREKLQEQEEQKKPEVPTLSEAEKHEYKRFGKEKELLKKINEMIEKSGIVGENQNRMFLFAVAVSHKMHQTLHAVVQGSSGSGKSYLIKKISNLVPQESVKRYTRLSEKSFYNFGEYELCHKLLIVEDYDGLNEEVEYAFRELQSDGKLISAVSWKENDQTKVETKDKTVRGPIASIVATTRGEIYHDNSTRVFFVRIDESEEQTKKIIDYQNKKANGEIREEEEQRTSQYLQGFVRTLQRYKVRNPWLKHIHLPVPHDQKRRLHEQLEAFSNMITLLHQYQRKRTVTGDLIAEKQDMQAAINLMFDSIVLKVDDLNGTLREFFEKLKSYVLQRGKEYEFTRREIRQSLAISKSMQHEYITKLQELEYIQQKGGYGNRGYIYKITYWDDNEALRGKIKKELEEQLKSIG